MVIHAMRPTVCLLQQTAKQHHTFPHIALLQDCRVGVIVDCSISCGSATQGLQGMRDSLFTLLGPPRPLDATIRAMEGKPLIQVCT